MPWGFSALAWDATGVVKRLFMNLDVHLPIVKIGEYFPTSIKVHWNQIHQRKIIRTSKFHSRNTLGVNVFTNKFVLLLQSPLQLGTFLLAELAVQAEDERPQCVQDWSGCLSQKLGHIKPVLSVFQKMYVWDAPPLPTWAWHPVPKFIEGFAVGDPQEHIQLSADRKEKYRNQIPSYTLFMDHEW